MSIRGSPHRPAGGQAPNLRSARARAVPHPTAGNIGGGGFLVYRAANGQATSYDFREAAPAGSNAEMWLKDGKYDYDLHHNSHRSVGVPGTVAGLHLAWKEQGLSLLHLPEPTRPYSISSAVFCL